MNLDIILDLITDVRRKNVNPETQIRQFLLAFKDTSTFKEAFDQLDAETQKKVLAFRDGASAGDLTSTHGFKLPPSAPAKHHFRLLDAFHSLFKHHPEEPAHPEPKSKLETGVDSEGVEAPVIYEDLDSKKLMKVRKRVSSFALVLITLYRLMQTFRSKIGVKA